MLFDSVLRNSNKNTRPSLLLFSCSLLALLLLLLCLFFSFIFMFFLFLSCAHCMFSFRLVRSFVCLHGCCCCSIFTIERIPFLFLFILSEEEEKNWKELKITKTIRCFCLVFRTIWLLLLLLKFSNATQTPPPMTNVFAFVFPEGYFNAHKYPTIFRIFISPKLNFFINIQFAREYWWRWYDQVVAVAVAHDDNT